MRGRTWRIRCRKPLMVVKRIVVAAWVTMMVSAASMNGIHAAGPITAKGTSAAQLRAIELQEQAPAQDLWENGDWWIDRQ